MKIISPEEVGSAKTAGIPQEVFDTFNYLIAKNWRWDRSVFAQQDVIEDLFKKGIKREDIFGFGYLNIEPFYTKHGWKVNYDKPAYNERYEPSFTFTKKSYETY